MGEHIVIDLGNETVLLKYGNELVRRYKSEVRRLPADKCFCTSQFVGAWIVFGLIINREFFVGNGLCLFILYAVEPFLILNDLLIKEGNA